MGKCGWIINIIIGVFNVTRRRRESNRNNIAAQH